MTCNQIYNTYIKSLHLTCIDLGILELPAIGIYFTATISPLQATFDALLYSHQGGAPSYKPVGIHKLTTCIYYSCRHQRSIQNTKYFTQCRACSYLQGHKESQKEFAVYSVGIVICMYISLQSLRQSAQQECLYMASMLSSPRVRVRCMRTRLCPPS